MVRPFFKERQLTLILMSFGESFFTSLKSLSPKPAREEGFTTLTGKLIGQVFEELGEISTIQNHSVLLAETLLI